MAKIYLEKMLRIKTGTTDELILSYYPPDLPPPVNTPPYYVDQQDGDIIISMTMFGKLVNGVWKCLYNSADHCQIGYPGSPGPPGQSASNVPIGSSKIIFVRYRPNYNVNCRVTGGYHIININDGRVYEWSIGIGNYVENVSMRITNG